MAVLGLGAFAASVSLAQDIAAAGQNSTSTYFDENGAYFGPNCDSVNYTGAYYTGDYTSPFKTILGKTDAEIQAKLDQLWNHYFKGDGNSRVYYDDNGKQMGAFNQGEAYIFDTGSHDVRSEGMSYGMMISVQTNHKEEFDKLWAWAKSHMWHKGGEWDGYFSWQIQPNGQSDAKPAPDGELYFMMSLLFAANRWDDNQYMEDAQYILDRMWNNSSYKLFNEGNNIVTFQPTMGNKDFSDPSYDLPAFLELFSRWSTTNQDKWKSALEATRNHLYVSSNGNTGLFTDYNNFDGTPHSGFSQDNPSDTYMFDAMRCAMNFGMDYYLFGADATRQTEMAKRIINFFKKDNYTHARFTWDGQVVSNHSQDRYTLGEMGANAVATYALMGEADYKDLVKENLEMAWNAQLATGDSRYYDGLVHYLAMLHLTGNFKIWKPKPEIKEKSVAAGEYNGTSHNEGDVIESYEECQLYKVTFIKGNDNGGSENGGSENGGSTDALRRMYAPSAVFKMQRDYDIRGCKVSGTNKARAAYYGKKVLVK